MAHDAGNQVDRKYALSGVRVVELAGDIPAAYCGYLLALLGADVVKVESRRDVSAQSGPFPGRVPSVGRSALYRFLHARKQSARIDTATATGKRILGKLLGTNGVLLDDGEFAPHTRTQDVYECIRDSAPTAIIANFSPFGMEGPHANYQSVHLTELAASGWLHSGGLPGREPLQPGSAMAQYGIGIIAALGVALAVYARQRHGIAQQVEVSGLEALLSLLAFPTTRFAYAGDGLGRLGDAFPFAIFPCRDGHIGVNILTKGHWTGLCELMGRPDLLTDPRFETAEARANPDSVSTLGQIIGEWARTQDAREAFHTGQRMRVPVSIIPSPKEVLESEHYAERNYWVDYFDNVLGCEMRLPGAPFRFSSGRMAPFEQAPTPGANTASLLSALGLSLEELNLLAAAGVTQ